jgi:serine/threonine protein kinase
MGTANSKPAVESPQVHKRASSFVPRRSATTFSQADLHDATDGFSPLNKLDEGAFGVVFKGTLTDGRPVAIKALKPSAPSDDDDPYSGLAGFVKEADVLSSRIHANIVELYGHCLNQPTVVTAPGVQRMQCGSPYAHFLVYEFMAGGNLKDRLRGSLSRQQPMLWSERFGVAAGIARGLKYLHTQVPIILHQDIKSDNILLAYDGNTGTLTAKIADFGAARFKPKRRRGASGGGQTQHHSTIHVVGTTPYMPLEYIQQGHVSPKTDTFAFGVVLLELLTAKPPVSGETGNLLSTECYSAVEKPERGDLMELLDRRGEAGQPAPLEKVYQLARIARRCIDLNVSMRTQVSEVVGQLNDMAGYDAAAAVQLAAAGGGGMERAAPPVPPRRNAAEDKKAAKAEAKKAEKAAREEKRAAKAKAKADKKAQSVGMARTSIEAPPRPTTTLATSDVRKYSKGQRVHSMGADHQTSGIVCEVQNLPSRPGYGGNIVLELYRTVDLETSEVRKYPINSRVLNIGNKTKVSGVVVAVTPRQQVGGPNDPQRGPGVVKIMHDV